MPIENPEKLLIVVAKVLDDVGIEYYVTGGFAVSIWGRPRATFDIDIVVALAEPKVKALGEALHRISQAGYFDEDVAREAIAHRGEFNFIEPDSGLKVDFWITKKNESARIRFKRRQPEMIGGRKVYVISAEDLILSKLEWYKKCESTRHLEDIESVLNISGEKLDWKYLRQWAAKLEVLPLLEKSLPGGDK